VTPASADPPAAVLCVFARAPALGRVKRRLARSLGPEAALSAHQRLVEDTLGRLAVVPGVVTELWIAGACNEVVSQWAARWALAVQLQRGADLGERMAHALRSGLERRAFALVVGADCPEIDGAYVRAAVRAAAAADLVLGPAEDGGYGLIGVGARGARGLDELFRDVPWGTDAVLEATLARARAQGLATHLLPVIWDVDEASDWRRYLALRGR
jgi:hypothetical protein